LKTAEKTKDSVPWGTVYARNHREEDVMQFGFKDNAFVLLLSTFFYGRELPIERLHRQSVKSSTSPKTARVPFNGQSTKLLKIPLFADAYNNNMNGVDIGDQLRAAFQTKGRIKHDGQQTLPYFFLIEVAITNTFFLQKRGWESPITQSSFRRLLYTQIFERFGSHVALVNRGVATSASLQQPHRKVRLQKRGYCAFCSSKMKNIITNEPQSPIAHKQRHKIITGCNACGVALCDNVKERRCWQEWHRQP
jgi:hypothetical protein